MSPLPPAKAGGTLVRSLLDVLKHAWNVPIPKAGAATVDSTLQGYRGYAIIAVFFAVFVARGGPASDDELGVNLLSSSAASIVAGVLDGLFGKNRILIQFNIIVTIVVLTLTFIVADTLTIGTNWYEHVAHDYDWYVPGLILAAPITWMLLVIKAGVQACGVSAAMVTQAILIVIVASMVLAVLLSIGDGTYNELNDWLSG